MALTNSDRGLPVVLRTRSGLGLEEAPGLGEKGGGRGSGLDCSNWEDEVAVGRCEPVLAAVRARPRGRTLTEALGKPPPQTALLVI